MPPQLDSVTPIDANTLQYKKLINEGPNMDKRFLAILAVIVIGFLGFFIIGRQKDNSSTNNSSVSATNHSVGAGTKKVTLVEYGDFQCPACGGFYPLIKQVKEKYGDQITFTFKNFPIDTIHPNARAAHRAAEAASNQGKFFEMHNELYENQQSWVNSNNVKSIFEGYASKLSLDMDKFKADYISESTNEVINADINEGKDKGVTGTPTFYLNGTQLDNNTIRTVDQLSALIDAEIAKQNPTPTTPAQSSTPSNQ